MGPQPRVATPATPAPGGRGGSLARVLRLLALMSAQRNPTSAERIAEVLGCEQRTVRRDLAILRACGFDVVSRRRKKAVLYRILRGAAIPVVCSRCGAVGDQLRDPPRTCPCGKPIPPGRTKSCSRECSVRRAQRKRAERDQEDHHG